MTATCRHEHEHVGQADQQRALMRRVRFRAGAPGTQ